VHSTQSGCNLRESVAPSLYHLTERADGVSPASSRRRTCNASLRLDALLKNVIRTQFAIEAARETISVGAIDIPEAPLEYHAGERGRDPHTPYTHTRTQTLAQHIHIRTRACMHARTYARMYAHAHTYEHTRVLAHPFSTVILLKILPVDFS
jgi:hypothetical protein